MTQKKLHKLIEAMAPENKDALIAGVVTALYTESGGMNPKEKVDPETQWDSDTVERVANVVNCYIPGLQKDEEY